MTMTMEVEILMRSVTHITMSNLVNTRTSHLYGVGFFYGQRKLSSLLKNRSADFVLRLLCVAWLVCSPKKKYFFLWYIDINTYIRVLINLKSNIMETIEINLYSFEELNYTAKERALSKFYDINVNHNWWEFIYYDAKELGILIKSFDLDRGKHIEIDIDSCYYCEDVANKIISTHGKTCQTYIISETFLKDREDIEFKYDDELINEEQFDDMISALEEEYTNDIANEYLTMLEKEYEYLTSEEAIIEMICANEYQFTEDGKLF